MGQHVRKADQQALALRINAAHNEASRLALGALEKARLAGELLAQARRDRPPGGWTGWVQANLAFGVRQAQSYVRLALNWDALRSRLADASPGDRPVSLRGALALLDDRATGRETMAEAPPARRGAPLRPEALARPGTLLALAEAAAAEMVRAGIVERGGQQEAAYAVLDALREAASRSLPAAV